MIDTIISVTVFVGAVSVLLYIAYDVARKI